MPPLRLFLDDLRAAPDGWTPCRWPSEVLEHLDTSTVEAISLDHDLGDAPAAVAEGRPEITGDLVLIALRERLELGHRAPPFVNIHSDNPDGIRRMLVGLERLWGRTRELGLPLPAAPHYPPGWSRHAEGLWRRVQPAVRRG